MEIVSSQLPIDGFMNIFEKYSLDKQTKFWSCRRKNNCLTRVRTRVDNTMVLKKFENNHTHDFEITKVETVLHSHLVL